MSTVVINKMASSLPGSEGFASVPLTKKPAELRLGSSVTSLQDKAL